MSPNRPRVPFYRIRNDPTTRYSNLSSSLRANIRSDNDLVRSFFFFIPSQSSFEKRDEPGRRQVGIRGVKISRRLGPPRARSSAIVAAAARPGRRPDAASLPVQRSASQFQLLPIHLLLLVTQQLVDEHAGKYAGEDTGHRDAEQGPEAGVQGAVHRLAVGRTLEQHSWISFRRPVTRARPASNRISIQYRFSRRRIYLTYLAFTV